MTRKTSERGIWELYEDDPARADALVFGRVTNPDRRGFLKGAGLATMGAVVGGAIPFADNMPAGLIPAALAQSTSALPISGKDGLTVLNDRPVNAETPAHLLDDAVTPNTRHFIRNNGIVPERASKQDLAGWSLTVDGEVNNPLQLDMDTLTRRFQSVTLQLQLECGGNGRAGFNPPARGNQWTVGAVGCASWTGARLGDVLKAAGIKDSAVYVAYYGEDLHLSRDPKKTPISRGAPVWKMMDPHTLLAYRMNGEPLPEWHGFPLRIVAPGWPGSVSGKWINRLWVRDKVHDGPKMTGASYRVPAYPVKPGDKVPPQDMRIIESMPVKSIITSPQSGARLPTDNRTMEVRGHAWAGDYEVVAVDITTDFGATWQAAELASPANPYAWQHWRARIRFPSKGYYEIWARAADSAGNMQPFAVDWNPRGYLNNSMHRVSVVVPT